MENMKYEISYEIVMNVNNLQRVTVYIDHIPVIATSLSKTKLLHSRMLQQSNISRSFLLQQIFLQCL